MRTWKMTLTLAAGAALLAGPALADIKGVCSDCHTMHNSEQNVAVAKKGVGGASTSTTPIQNLLRYDCVACHAMSDTGGKLALLDGGSIVPQVYHGTDPTDTDSYGTGFLQKNLAGGNFKYAAAGNRKGHQVKDIVAAGDTTGGAYTYPPGFRHAAAGQTQLPLSEFTCAGDNGCHGTRNQLVTDSKGLVTQPRTGIAAVTGAHHMSFDGLKDPAQVTNANAAHSGKHVAQSYRFIRGLKGMGNTNNTLNDINQSTRWQNKDAGSHNEYFGVKDGYFAKAGGTCTVCHANTQAKAADSAIIIPNQSMSGFCATCHSQFHSTGTVDEITPNADPAIGPGGTTIQATLNGVSGAFLRHPSDYVIPNAREYAAYQTYTVTAPVARPDLTAIADSQAVSPGTDMVMCLSCHVAHASPNDGMLRFDYAKQTSQMRAGDSAMMNFDGSGGMGCLACHTSKGVAPTDRQGAIEAMNPTNNL